MQKGKCPGPTHPSAGYWKTQATLAPVSYTHLDVYKRQVLDGSYQVKIFCSEFTRIYDLEVDYEQLSELENKEFGDLCEMVGRFSADEEELKIPNMFFSEESILNKAKYVKQLLE